MYDSALLRVRPAAAANGELDAEPPFCPMRRPACQEVSAHPGSLAQPKGGGSAQVVGRMQRDHPHTVYQWSPAGSPHNDDSDLENETEVADYNSKVIFALKLGYSESQLQNALIKLGPNAGENQILEELIRLQKANQTHLSNPISSTSLPYDNSLSSWPSSSFQLAEQHLLPIVIDGSNVAISHGNKETFSCKGIRICVQWFQARGHKDITVFVPKWRNEAPKPEAPISDQHILEELEKQRILSYTPSRQVLGRRYVCHDDRYILNLAAATDAVVVSNDNYRDLIGEKSEFKRVIEEKILMYSFVNDRFMPPDDPLGRKGPNLDAFLRKKAKNAGQTIGCKPCPYDKKCTYGVKCKFFHADSSNHPHQSISEALKKTSSLKIHDFYRRSHSRDSSPGKEGVGEQDCF